MDATSFLLLIACLHDKEAGASGSSMTASGVHIAPVGCILAFCGVIRHLAYARTEAGGSNARGRLQRTNFLNHPKLARN